MRHIVLLFVALAGALAYVQRMALTVPSKTIQADLHLSLEAMGVVLGAWYWSYALLQIPCGWLADRFGGRWALLLFVVLWSLLVGAVGLAFGFMSLLGFWVAMGAAQAGLIPAMAKNLSTWYPPTERAFASGVFIAAMALGGALAPTIAAHLLQIVSWRGLLALYVVPGFLWGVLFLAIVPHQRETPTIPVAWRAGVARIATSVPMQLLCLQMFLRAAAMAFFYTWFPRFLQETRNVTPLASGSLAFWPGLGGVLGGVFGGMLSDVVLRATGNRRLSRQGVAIGGMVCCAALAGTAYLIEDTNVAVLLISLGAFAGTAGGVSGYSVAIELGGQRPALVISVMNMCGSVGAGLFAFLISVLVSYFKRWEPILLIFAGLFALDAVCWVCLNPKQPLFPDPAPERKP